MHRKLRQAGVVADLHVFEGQSHAQYAGDPDAPETKEHFGELTAFFDKYLAKWGHGQSPIDWDRRLKTSGRAGLADRGCAKHSRKGHALYRVAQKEPTLL